MKAAILIMAMLASAGCAQIEPRVDQGQEALEQANSVKAREALEVLCRRVYTSTFNSVFTTTESRQAWRDLCRQDAP